MTYLLTDLTTGNRHAYKRIGDFLEDQRNGIFMTPRNWSNISKTYPVFYAGWKVEKLDDKIVQCIEHDGELIPIIEKEKILKDQII